MNKNLLELRKRIKSKKPYFVSQDINKRKRIRERWRKPRGWQSKMRLQRKGHRKCVKPGYGSPKDVYGLHSSGLEMLRINSEKELKDINPKTQGIIVAGAVGLKKRIELIKKAKEAGITILNIKNADLFLKNIEEERRKKKEEKAKEGEKKEKAEKKKKASKKKEQAPKKSEEERKEEEKKEKDKILTKKEM